MAPEHFLPVLEIYVRVVSTGLFHAYPDYGLRQKNKRSLKKTALSTFVKFNQFLVSMRFWRYSRVFTR